MTYFYISIRGYVDYSKAITVNRVRDVLDQYPELEHKGKRKYVNSTSFSWLLISLINCDSKGNYPANLPQNNATCNLITIVASIDEAFSELAIIKLSQKIAANLNWEVVNDETDEVL